MASVTFEGVSIAVDGSVLVAGVDLHVPDGSITAIVGPSGAGKSTLLRSIAGLNRVVDGRLLVGDTDVTDARPGDRDVSMVFQEPALMPRRTARRNVEFPLEIRRETLESIRQRVDAEARALHIEYLLEQHPGTLSRGEEQLVQMARALVRVPHVLLLDEPFAPLDEPRRRAMRADLKILQEGYGVTTIVASNDPTDATVLASQVVVVQPGGPGGPARVTQVGTVSAVHDEPASLDAASALGDLWIVRAEVRAGDDGAWLVGSTDPSFRLRSWSPAVRARQGESVTVGIRTGDVRLANTGAHEGVVRRMVPGSEPRTIVELGGHLVASVDVDDVSPGDQVRVDLLRPYVFDSSGVRLA